MAGTLLPGLANHSIPSALDDIECCLSFAIRRTRNAAISMRLLDERIEHVTARIAELQALEKQLKSLRCLCKQESSSKECGILNELAAEAQSRQQ